MHSKTPRNNGIRLTPELFEAVDVNQPAAMRRVSELVTDRSVKKQWKIAWLIKTIQAIDLTTLAGDDTPERIKRLCAKARSPVRPDLVQALNLQAASLTTAAICVYPVMANIAVQTLKGSGISTAVVAAGFPAGLTPFPQRLAEVEYAIEQGAEEIDMVITRAHVLEENWSALYDEVKSVREICGSSHLKVILATGELKTLTSIYRAGMVSMMAGADFIKTSTGMETVNATLPVGLIMARSIRDYWWATGFQVGLKPAGGIKTAKDALAWLFLMREELGEGWMKPDLFRIGASSLLRDIECQIEHYVTGRHSAIHRHAIG